MEDEDAELELWRQRRADLTWTLAKHPWWSAIATSVMDVDASLSSLMQSWPSDAMPEAVLGAAFRAVARCYEDGAKGTAAIGRIASFMARADHRDAASAPRRPAPPAAGPPSRPGPVMTPEEMERARKLRESTLALWRPPILATDDADAAAADPSPAADAAMEQGAAS